VLTVAAPGLIPAPGSDGSKTFLISKSEAVENVDFALVRGGVITGKVTDTDGRPLVEEEITLFPVDFRNSYLRTQIRTDDRGIYRLFGISPGKYKIAAGKDEGEFGSRGGGYRRAFHPAATEASQATIIEVSEGSEATDVDITLPELTANYTVYGRIIDGETGQPIANVSYGVQKYVSENSTVSLSTGAVSNKDGEFKFENLPPGKYAVFVDVPPDSDWRSEYERFEVIDRDVTGLIIKTIKGTSASGVIVLEGTDDKTIHERLWKARLYAHVLSPDFASTSTSSSTINQNGGFRLGGLQAGVLSFGINARRFYVVRVERAGVAQPQGIELKDREQITGLRVIVNYASGAIQGVVKVNGGPIPANGQVDVSVKRLGDLPTASSSFNDSTRVDARGQFFSEGLLSGTYEVTAAYAPDTRTRWSRVSQQVIVTSGAVANVTLSVDTNANPGRP
jgi:protocatechuate 3,4-dioxygenase beta subunit